MLTPSHELSLDRAAAICDRMPFKGKFSVAKTATGILFKFSNAEDCAAVLRKGFHRVTGARLYRKVSLLYLLFLATIKAKSQPSSVRRNDCQIFTSYPRINVFTV